MFVELTPIPFGEYVVINGVFDDANTLTDLLGASPVGDFNYHAVCTPLDGKLDVELTVTGKVRARCDLCGDETIAECLGEIQDVFTTEDPEYDFVRNGYNLDKFLIECIVLSAPREVRCKPDCKGLCLKCGTNLNKGECHCYDNPIGDNNPFGILKDIILNGGASNGSTKK